MGKIYTGSKEAEDFIKEYWLWIILILIGVTLYFLAKIFIGKPFFP
jgi:hypothetical protein